MALRAFSSVARVSASDTDTASALERSSSSRTRDLVDGANRLTGDAKSVHDVDSSAASSSFTSSVTLSDSDASAGRSHDAIDGGDVTSSARRRRQLFPRVNRRDAHHPNGDVATPSSPEMSAAMNEITLGSVRSELRTVFPVSVVNSDSGSMPKSAATDVALARRSRMMLARTADSLSSDDEYESVRSTSVNASKDADSTLGAALGNVSRLEKRLVVAALESEPPAACALTST